MATATAPIKVDVATDELVSHAAHFMSRSKKSIVDDAVREYIDTHREEINAGVKDCRALGQLNGSDAAAISLLTGFPALTNSRTSAAYPSKRLFAARSDVGLPARFAEWTRNRSVCGQRGEGRSGSAPLVEGSRTVPRATSTPSCSGNARPGRPSPLNLFFLPNGTGIVSRRAGHRLAA